MKDLYIDFLLYDVLPWAVILTLLILAFLYAPQALIGAVIGWLVCKFQTQLKDFFLKLHSKVKRSDDNGGVASL